MIVYHKDYLKLEIPDSWIFEEQEDTAHIYNYNGCGALTLSFLSTLDEGCNSETFVCALAKKFAKQNDINLCNSLLFCENKNNTIYVYGKGNTSDMWFVKIWLVAKAHKIIVASYQSEQESDEIKICDDIINSIFFIG